MTKVDLTALRAKKQNMDAEVQAIIKNARDRVQTEINKGVMELISEKLGQINRLYEECADLADEFKVPFNAWGPQHSETRHYVPAMTDEEIRDKARDEGWQYSSGCSYGDDGTPYRDKETTGWQLGSNFK